MILSKQTLEHGNRLNISTHSEEMKQVP